MSPALFHDVAPLTPNPFNPLGAKGIGEAATVGSTPAVVNAAARLVVRNSQNGPSFDDVVGSEQHRRGNRHAESAGRSEV